MRLSLQGKNSLRVGQQTASLGWHEHYYLDPPRLTGCAKAAKAFYDYIQMTDWKSLFSATRPVCKVNQCHHAAASTRRIYDTHTCTQSILCFYPRVKFCFAVNKGNLQAWVRGKILIYTSKKGGYHCWIITLYSHLSNYLLWRISKFKQAEIDTTAFPAWLKVTPAPYQQRC